MATLALTIFLLVIAVACCGVGSFGIYQHNRGQKFPLSQKVCVNLSAAGAFIALFVAFKTMR